MSPVVAYLRERGHDRISAAFAPGRINLIGEHTDYNNGFVLPAAIERGVVAAVSMVTEPTLTIASLQHPDEQIVLNMDSLSPGAVTGWGAYVAGAVWSLVTESPINAGLFVVIDGDVPIGAGLSSSAALECSVLVALTDCLRLQFSARELARMAQHAENDFVGVPTGAMDQVASMMCERGSALFFDVRDDFITPVPLRTKESGLSLVVIDTRASHALVDGGYAARRESCEKAAGLLGLTSLREVDQLDQACEWLAAHADSNTLVSRTRHVVTENLRVLEAVTALNGGEFVRLGELMCDSHASLRDDFDVSCPELDSAVEASMRAGALGARMMGGGFGGSALALVDSARVSGLRAEVEREYSARGFAPAVVIEVEPGPGARLITAN